MAPKTDEVVRLLKKILPSATPIVEPMAGGFLVALVRPRDYGQPPDEDKIMKLLESENQEIADSIWDKKIRFFRDDEAVFNRSAELLIGLYRGHPYDVDVHVHALEAEVLLYDAARSHDARKVLATKASCGVKVTLPKLLPTDLA